MRGYQLAFRGGPLDGLEVEDWPSHEIVDGRIFHIPHLGRFEQYMIEGCRVEDPEGPIIVNVIYLHPLARDLSEYEP